MKYILILGAIVFSSFIMNSGIIDVMPSARLSNNTMSFCIVAHVKVTVSVSDDLMNDKVFEPNQCECFEEVPVRVYTIDAKSTTNNKLLKRVILRP